MIRYKVVFLVLEPVTLEFRWADTGTEIIYHQIEVGWGLPLLRLAKAVL